ncbi:MAG: NnrS family protein [Mariprofundaceae bacterium]
MRLWRILFAAVHRPFFLAGIVYAMLAIGLWVMHFTGLLPFTTSLPQTWVHMAQMIYFFFSFYVFGFLLTVFPRLMSMPAIAQRTFTPIFLGYFSGSLLFTLGLYVNGPWLLAGALLGCIAFGAAAYQLLIILLRSDYPHKQMPLFMWVGVAFGLLGLVCFAMSTIFDAPLWGQLAKAIGIYGFLLPTVYAVAYRMVPIFTVQSGHDVRRMRYGLQLMLTFSLLRMLLMAWDAHALYWLADTGLLAVITCQLWQWKVWRPKLFVIQSVLHWALLWFPIAFLLSAGISLAECLHGDRWLMAEQAALHALFVGGFGTLILGMATRVTLGHSGRPVHSDRYTNVLFVAFQIVPLTRVTGGMLAEFWPSFVYYGAYLSGLGWVIFFSLWAWRYLPIYLQPRVDGKPG